MTELPHIAPTTPQVPWERLHLDGTLVGTMRQLLVAPVQASGVCERLGMALGSTILLYGAPGVGKSSLVKACVTESGATLLEVRPHELWRLEGGDGQKVLAKAFARAERLLPAVILVHDVHLCSGSALGWELITQLGEVGQAGPLAVVGTTHRPLDLCGDLIRRFTHRLRVPLPDEADRASILADLLAPVACAPELELGALAQRTARFSARDLSRLCQMAGVVAGRSGHREVTRDDFSKALQQVHPTATGGLVAHYDSLQNTLGSVSLPPAQPL